MDQGELYTQKIEVLLEMQNKKLLGELEGIRKELQDLKDQVSSIKRMQASAPAAQASVRAAPVATPASESVSVAAPAATSPGSKPIDRNNVAPDKVSIEKIFYFGSK